MGHDLGKIILDCVGVHNVTTESLRTKASKSRKAETAEMKAEVSGGYSSFSAAAF